MPRTSDAREKMVVSAALLLRERGIARTRFDDVIGHAEAPRGSIAHHFPQGKRQLVAEAVLWAGGQASQALRSAAEDGTSADLVRLIFALYRQALVDTGFMAGCPVGTVAQEGFHDDALRAAASEVFGAWRGVLGEALVREGHDAAGARATANVMIAGIEGALMLARVDGDTSSLDDVEAAVLELLESRG